MRNVILMFVATALTVGLHHSAPAQTTAGPTMLFVPGGQFEMGDHFGFVDPAHPSDEIPIHTVKVDSMYVGKFDVTVQQYCDYLNSASSQGQIRVSEGSVYAVGATDLLFQTRQADQYSRVGWDGSRFSVLENRGDHPVTSVRWHGAAAYANWLSARQGYQSCYSTSTWACDFAKVGYKFPTEAEWEHSARGEQYSAGAAPGVFLSPELLGRPTATSATVNAVAGRDLEVYFEYGTSPGVYLLQTAAALCPANKRIEQVMERLQPNRQYYYRMRYREGGVGQFSAGEEHTFRTQRLPGSTFTVAIEADPHMDDNSDGSTWQLTLQNMVAGRPDFLVDLGDNFMSDKLQRQTYETVLDRAMLLRSYYAIAGHSIPLFPALGNHEGEWGSRLTNSAENLPVWDTLIRKLYYPNPYPDGFYTGGSQEEKYVGLRESYYAWEWGDALFVVLDPYWYTPQSPELSGDWSLTLGRTQYEWLKRTLESSRSTFKFVFCHNLVGGWNKNGTGPMRGGVEAAEYLEWGGRNLDGSWGFDKARPGWAMPIHKLLVANGVTIFFHGHDHFYGKQDLDGVVYQEVPQPAARNTELGNRAASYGYTEGNLLGGTGYLQLSVSPTESRVDYIQTWTPENETGGRKNGQVADTYTIPARDRTRAALDVASGGTAVTETAGISEVLQLGYASATLTLGSSPYGNAVFSHSENGTVVSEAAVPASAPSTGFRIFVDQGTRVPAGPPHLGAYPVDVYTGIAAVNSGTAAAHFAVTLRDSQGTTLASGHGTLAPGTHRARFLHQFQDLAPDFAFPPDFPLTTRFGSLEVTCDVPISITALRMTVNQRSEALFTTVPVADLSATSSSALCFPHVADGDGYLTSFIFLNTSQQPQSGTVHFHGDDGSPLAVRRIGGTTGSSFRYVIPAGGTYVFQTDGSPASLHTGSAQLAPDFGTTAPAGAGIFSRTADGVLVTESGIPSATPTKHARIYVDMARGHDSGLAVAAFSAPEAVSISLKAFLADGSTAVGSQTSSLALVPNGHAAAFVRQWVSGLPPEFRGVLDVSSSSAFAALTLRALTNSRNDFLLTTFPVADLSRAAPSPVIFPHLADGDGYVTEFILLSAGSSAAAILRYIGDDGSPLAIAR
jgi:hypothetical protein